MATVLSLAMMFSVMALCVSASEAENHETCTCSNNEIQPRYVPCPVGPGPCGKNDLLDKYPDEDLAGIYIIWVYGCKMCGGIDHIVKEKVV